MEFPPLHPFNFVIVHREKKVILHSSLIFHYGSEQPDFETLHCHHSLFHELGSEWMSQQENEWAQCASESSRAEEANEWAVQAYEQMDKRMAKYVLTLG